MDEKRLKVIDSKKCKKKLHPKAESILRTLGIIFLLCFIAFCIAAIRLSIEEDSKLNKSTSNSSNESTTKTNSNSIIDSIIPLNPTNNDAVFKDVAELFNQSGDSKFVEQTFNAYKYNNYMKQLSYTYSTDLNTKMYAYENKTIVYLNDNTGIVKLFIFNTNDRTLIKSIKTVIPVSELYTSPFIVIDGEIYYIYADNYREDGCLKVRSPLTINKYDLTTDEERLFVKYDDSLEFGINCGE